MWAEEVMAEVRDGIAWKQPQFYTPLVQFFRGLPFQMPFHLNRKL